MVRACRVGVGVGDLEETMQQSPSELSGGMRRGGGSARAVVTEPERGLYDSPTAGLDPITANTIMALIVKERDMRNTAALMATHRYPVSYTHLRAHETALDLVCRLLLENNNNTHTQHNTTQSHTHYRNIRHTNHIRLTEINRIQM